MPSAFVHPIASRRTEPRQWPIERAYLAALKDLGMSDPTIAQYFRVELDQVAQLRSSYGISEAQVLPIRLSRSRLFPWRRSA